MIKQDFEDAFILWLSGAAEMKNEKEIKWNAGRQGVTIEFPTGTPTHAIVRGFECSCHYESIFMDGVIDYAQGWHKNGNLAWKSFFMNGNLHGEYKEWDESGRIIIHRVYDNNRFVKDVI